MCRSVHVPSNVIEVHYNQHQNGNNRRHHFNEFFAVFFSPCFMYKLSTPQHQPSGGGLS